MENNWMNETHAGSKHGVTSELCAFLARSKFENLPPSTVHAAKRGLLDWLGCAFVGSTQPSLEPVIAVLQDVGGRAEATVLGRKLKLGILEAPIANGYMGHVLDYDDTHSTTLHSSSAVLSALFALCERKSVSGKELLLAYVCGLEAGVRVGRASPKHHAGGWHLTGTLGTIAAGAGVAKLLNLGPHGISQAMGIAASQSAGMQQNRGTMTKYLHAGKAASNGVISGLLAQRGFTSSSEIIEGARGFCRIYSEVSAPERLVNDLGEPWEMERNGYKPYACAVVLHSVIDAMIAIKNQNKIDPDKVSRINVTVHPYVISITGVMDPKNGIQARFSVTHSAAIGLLDGVGGAAQYSDERVLDESVVKMRKVVRVTVDDSLRVDQAKASVVAAGREYESVIEHQSGTVENPMTDSAIKAKFMAHATPVIGRQSAEKLSELVWNLEGLADMRDLLSLCA